MYRCSVHGMPLVREGPEKSWQMDVLVTSVFLAAMAWGGGPGVACVLLTTVLPWLTSSYLSGPGPAELNRAT